MGKKEKIERNIIIAPVGKHRPNSVNYKISLPVEMMRELGITKDDPTVNIYMKDKKIIIEKKSK